MATCNLTGRGDLRSIARRAWVRGWRRQIDQGGRIGRHLAVSVVVDEVDL